MRLERVLETVLYYTSGQEDALAEFYGGVLGLHRIGDGLTFRIGDGLLLLFDADRSVLQSSPPAHGARGSVHTCFVSAREDYENWKRRLIDNAVEIVEEIGWENGVSSFYFRDPSGNVLEIADGDLWPAQ